MAVVACRDCRGPYWGLIRGHSLHMSYSLNSLKGDYIRII